MVQKRNRLKRVTPGGPRANLEMKVHPHGVGGLPGPVVEVGPGSDPGTPVSLRVGRHGDDIVIGFGDMAFVCNAEVAQMFAEGLLSSVAAVRGKGHE